MIATSRTVLRVTRADRDDPHWDAFVRASPESTFCHLSGWRHVVEDVLGREYIPLIALTTDGEWQAILPLVRIRAPLLGHSLVSVPYVNYGGPIGTPEGRRQLAEAAVMEALRTRAGRVQLRCRESLDATVPAHAHKVMVLLDLPETPESLWAGFPSKLRSQIRRPQKEGMSFRMGRDQLDSFYGVFARNMRDLGTPVHDRGFFQALADTFADVVFGAVYWQGRPVAAACGFVWRGEFEITWASSIRDYNAMAPNMMLYCSLMEAMIARGVKVFNFGRSSQGAGTHRFKTQWGGREIPLPWIEWSARGAVDAAVPGSLARLASCAWQRLPLALANQLGPPLARRLPWW